MSEIYRPQLLTLQFLNCPYFSEKEAIGPALVMRWDFPHHRNFKVNPSQRARPRIPFTDSMTRGSDNTRCEHVLQQFCHLNNIVPSKEDVIEVMRCDKLLHKDLVRVTTEKIHELVVIYAKYLFKSVPGNIGLEITKYCDLKISSFLVLY